MIQFTGNWYIDMGIIGMLNLLKNEFPDKDVMEFANMEDEELSNAFLYAFLKSQLTKRKKSNEREKNELELIERGEKKDKKGNVKELNTKQKEKLATLREVMPYRQRLLDSLNPENNPIDSFSKIRKLPAYAGLIEKRLPKIPPHGRVPLGSTLYTNLWFFNNWCDYPSQRELLEEIILGRIEDATSVQTQSFDKTINKLLYSFEEMPNASFVANASLNKNLPNKQALLSLLSLETSTISINGIYYFFYSPDLEFTYLVNNSLQKRVEQLKDERNIDLLKVTYQTIFDNLYALQSEWALKNMTFVSYKEMSNQGVNDFLTLGIRDFEAKIIFDEDLRKILNTSIDQGKKQPKNWLIKNLIEGNSMLSKLFLGIKNDKYISSRVVQTSLAVELVRKNIQSKQKEANCFRFSSLMSASKDMGKVVEKVKEEKKRIYNASKDYQSVIEGNSKELGNEMQFAISLIKRNQRYPFINNIMRKLMKTGDISARDRVIQYLFENITHKDTWQYYALGLIFQNFNQTEKING